MDCPKCGYVMSDLDAECPRCRRFAQQGGKAPQAAPPPITGPPPPPPPPPMPSAPARSAGVTLESIVPVRNGQALGAYYIGLFSLMPFVGLPMGITALVLGCRGLSCNRQHPEVKGVVHAWVGILCGSFWALVNAVLIVFVIQVYSD